MLVFDDPNRMRRWSWAERSAGRTIAIVPTMGALHAGHLALVEQAAGLADVVVVTVFVNPLQFDREADLTTYPRPIDEDLALCGDADVAAVYAPTASTMYPDGFQTHVEPGPLAARFEGERRPGHFRGVATVVTKLIAATSPDLAVFGEKDFQQLAIIRRLVADLDLGVQVVGFPTVREPDGLAMSSRNRNLGPAERTAAVVVRAALVAAADAHSGGERNPAVLERVAIDVIGTEPMAQIDYVAVVDSRTLMPFAGSPTPTIDGPAVVLAAVWFGDVRLIDNQRFDQ